MSWRPTGEADQRSGGKMIEDISKFVPGARIRRGAPTNSWNGFVVFNNTIGLYSEEYPKNDWEYLGKGFMVRYDEVGLVFTEEVGDEEVIAAE